jgi:hypothetical protein
MLGQHHSHRRRFQLLAALGPWRLGLVSVMALAFCSCRDSAPGDAERAEGTSPSAMSATTDVAEVDQADTTADAQQQHTESAAGAGGDQSADDVETAESSDDAADRSGEGSAAQTASSSDEAMSTADKEGKNVATADVRSQREYPLQDNPLAGCSLCHVDVEDKFVGSKHFEEKVGCQTCHGPSEGHVADENNDVKPDELFVRKDVDELCGICHDCGRPKPPAPELTAQGEPKVCTDCHGNHDLALAQ